MIFVSLIKYLGVFAMVSAELLNTLRNFNRADKLYIMQVLVSELAQAKTNLIQPDQEYPVWSPYDAFEAADTMLQVLEKAKTKTHE
ncbi:hypothetical protein Sta7437_2294 [Stanieria cyanosphaera PCC 7437]|uniref:Uncharacterized protein n=2 Tax=Stanieria cyanosphaera TaxID=102116 RepID=K9XUT1_STAC7|nr:hypothetical protein Sta7437_2294 [Stanieria cyanosphaera PCC 7437]